MIGKSVAKSSRHWKTVKISGHTKPYAVLGHPIGHTLSPVMHNAAFQALGMDALYLAFDVHPDRLMSVLPAMADMGFGGVNLTVPLKEVALRGLAKLDESAQLLGAVNTVKVEEDGTLAGYNTDGAGFLESLKRNGANDLKRPILILGSGGAAKGIALYLAAEGAAEIDLAVRNLEKGEELSARIRESGAASRLYSLGRLEEPELGRYGLIVQTTPLGMKNVVGTLDFPYERLEKEQVVADIVYNPLETEFLKNCGAAGAKAIGGLEMLVYQGYHSFRIWTGLEGDPELMLETGRKILEATHE